MNIKILLKVFTNASFCFFIFIYFFIFFNYTIISILLSFSLFCLFFVHNFRISNKLSLRWISFFFIILKECIIWFFILRLISLAWRRRIRFARSLRMIFTLIFNHFDICSLFRCSFFSYWVIIFWLGTFLFLTLGQWLDVLILFFNLMIYLLILVIWNNLNLMINNL